MYSDLRASTARQHRQRFLIGGESSGIQMKLVVNPLLGIDMQAVAEAVSLGDHLRIDRDVLLRDLSKSAVITPAMAGKLRKIKERDYCPEFESRLISKEMDLVIKATKKPGADLLQPPSPSPSWHPILASKLSSTGNPDLPAITLFVIAQGSRAEVERVRAPTGNRSSGKCSRKVHRWHLGFRPEPSGVFWCESFEAVAESNGR